MESEAPSGWQVNQLGEVTAVIVSNVDKKSKAGEPPVRLCNYMDVYRNETITSQIDFMHATATPVQIENFGLRRGDVMITKDSGDPTDIAVPAVVVDDFTDHVLCGYHLALLRPKDIDGEPKHGRHEGAVGPAAGLPLGVTTRTAAWPTI